MTSAVPVSFPAPQTLVDPTELAQSAEVPADGFLLRVEFDDVLHLHQLVDGALTSGRLPLNPACGLPTGAAVRATLVHPVSTAQMDIETRVAWDVGARGEAFPFLDFESLPPLVRDAVEAFAAGFSDGAELELVEVPASEAHVPVPYDSSTLVMPEKRMEEVRAQDRAIRRRDDSITKIAPPPTVEWLRAACARPHGT